MILKKLMPGCPDLTLESLIMYGFAVSAIFLKKKWASISKGGYFNSLVWKKPASLTETSSSEIESNIIKYIKQLMVINKPTFFYRI